MHHKRTTPNVLMRWLLSFALIASLSPALWAADTLAWAAEPGSYIEEADVAANASSQPAADNLSESDNQSESDGLDPILEEQCQEAEFERASLLAEAANLSADVPSFTLGFATVSEIPVTLSPQIAGNHTYFFLPAGAQITDVTISFRTDSGETLCILDSAGASWTDLTSGQSLDLGSYLMRESDSERSFTIGTKANGEIASTAQYRVMQSSNIASVFLASSDPDSKGRDYIEGSADHSTKAPGSIRVLSSDSSERYAGEFSAIKGRGNTSWTAASKKSYQVKLNSKADLLDAANHEGATEKAKKWLLIGNPFDPTLMRNELTYQLAKDVGIPATVDCEAVDLYYDGEYRGSYLLAEKVEIGKGRVEIHDLESDIEEANPGVNLESLPTITAKTSYGASMQFVSGIRDPYDYSGGYLLELDDAFYASEKSWFATSSGRHFVSKSPEFLSLEQMRYISTLVNDAMLCMENGGKHPRTGKQLFDYFDKNSLVRYFFVQEFCKNADEFFSSTYFYVPRGETKLYAGPIWDCDGTYGIRTELSSFKSTDSWLVRNGFGALLKSDAFCTALMSTYNSEIKPVVKNLVYGDASSVGSIAYYSQKNEPSRLMNAKIWGVAQPMALATQYPSYEAALSALRTWAQKRLAWMDKEIANLNERMAEMHRMYNPNSGEHFYTASSGERDNLVKAGWRYEGTGWFAPLSSNTPVYRLYSGTDHHYTSSSAERNMLIAAGWRYEGIGWYSDDAKRVPLYRQFNPNVDPNAATNNSGSHNYTTSKGENDFLASVGWNEEGIGWYGCRAAL